MAKLLIYTADAEFADALIRSLRREGHFCKVVEDEETALREIRGQGYSLILLDDAPALPSVKDLRNWSAMPIMLLVEPTRLPNQSTPIEADDAIVKPVREEELIFRVQNLCTRSRGSSYKTENSSREVENLTLDEDRYEFRLDGVPVSLTFREFELLKLLMKNPGHVFDRERLLDLVWGADYIGGARTVDVHIRRIRSKIEVGGRPFISTVRGVGYKFNEGTR
ncbi:MAG: response regulator transcription factor [Nitrospinota bacterium]|jgi:two-component system response regulator RegX3|nr:response regulator transcription factor [Nitrospinota bacterium]